MAASGFDWNGRSRAKPGKLVERRRSVPPRRCACGGLALFGYGHSELRGVEGRWYCAACRPDRPP